MGYRQSALVALLGTNKVWKVLHLTGSTTSLSSDRDVIMCSATQGIMKMSPQPDDQFGLTER